VRGYKIFFRARYYDAGLGRFIGRDPLGYVDGMSLYDGYFVPNYIDPMGEHISVIVKHMGLGSHCRIMVEFCDGSFETLETTDYGNMDNSGPEAGKRPWDRIIPSNTTARKENAGRDHQVYDNLTAMRDYTVYEDEYIIYFNETMSDDADPECCDDAKEREFVDNASSVQFGAYNLLYNNCCHWAQDVVEDGGYRWNVPDINGGFNQGDNDEERENERRRQERRQRRAFSNGLR